MKTNKSTARAYQCVTIKQHFNHLRNNSSTMRGILSWNLEEQESSNIEHSSIAHEKEGNLRKQTKIELDSKKRNVSFDIDQNIENQNNSPIHKIPQQNIKRANSAQNSTRNSQNITNASASLKKTNKIENKDAEIRQKIRQKQLEQNAKNKQLRRQKVQKYIEQLMPYTRNLTNTKYQDYYNKAALESYGRANTKNAIGGIIYGNHQKTFNLNPHIHDNNPKYYQTHTTAINYGKRTKLNEQDKWNRLQKQLTKKLGLKDKNQTLKQGKQVVYVDVDDHNMYSVMKQNLAFKRQHDDKIRSLQQEYKKMIQDQQKAAAQSFYAQKIQRIQKNCTLQSQRQKYVCPRDENGRLQEQLIYRHHDKDGNIRYGADRHALTCFVDMNFPQNDAAYTEDLKSRLPIYPIQVQEKDQHIDSLRRNNYKNSLVNIYPSHYLMPNCDQPQIVKMLQEKYPVENKLLNSANFTKDLASTLGTTIQNKQQFRGRS